jgi:hypothetical protein
LKANKQLIAKYERFANDKLNCCTSSGFQVDLKLHYAAAAPIGTNPVSYVYKNLAMTFLHAAYTLLMYPAGANWLFSCSLLPAMMVPGWSWSTHVAVTS